MQWQRFIEESESPWSSPIILIQKNRDLCSSIDYRKLNDVTRKDCFQLPRIDSTLNILAGGKWVSNMDLKSGGSVARQQEEDCVLNGPRAIAVHSHALWPLKCSSDILEVNRDHLKRPHLWIISRVPGCDCNWPHVPRVPAKPVDKNPLVPRSRLKLKSKKFKLFQKEVQYLGHTILCHLRQ
jgi:hypothetical protein